MFKIGICYRLIDLQTAFLEVVKLFYLYFRRLSLKIGCQLIYLSFYKPFHEQITEFSRLIAPNVYH